MGVSGVSVGVSGVSGQVSVSVWLSQSCLVSPTIRLSIKYQTFTAAFFFRELLTRDDLNDQVIFVSRNIKYRNFMSHRGPFLLRNMIKLKFLHNWRRTFHSVSSVSVQGVVANFNYFPALYCGHHVMRN